MMNNLYELGSSSRDQLQAWEKEALDKFFAKMGDKERPFPCIPATIGYSMNHLKYGFVGSPSKDTTINEFASLLSIYSKKSREFGIYTSLIIFFETPESIIDMSVEEYEQLFWEQLSQLSVLDEFDWPEDIPQDPHDPIWEFCFNGEKYFIYCATPAHQNRKSRHFDVMMLAITPRWVLQEFNKSKNYAKRIKEQVRKRLAKYDSISIHPDLNTYGAEDNFEWRQYFLRDDDRSLSKCPYHRVLKFLGKNN